MALRQRPLVTTSASTNPLPPLAPAVSLAKRTQIHTRLASELDRVAIYDRIELQDIAREQIPVDRLHEAANKCISSVSLSSTSFQEELLKQLLTWFKADYFSWVDNLSCESCGSTSTRAVSPSNGPSSLHTGPTAEDIKHGAHRVELYQCSHCNSISRFPRYKYVKQECRVGGGGGGGGSVENGDN